MHPKIIKQFLERFPDMGAQLAPALIAGMEKCVNDYRRGVVLTLLHTVLLQGKNDRVLSACTDCADALAAQLVSVLHRSTARTGADEKGGEGGSSVKMKFIREVLKFTVV